MIDTNLIQTDFTGAKTLNPRQTFGWNAELEQVINDYPVDWSSVTDFIKDVITYDPELLKQYLAQYRTQPKPETLAKILRNYIPVYGYGHSAKSAVQSATRRFSQKFKRLMPGQYENLAAYKWEYLDPQFLGIYKIVTPNAKPIIIIGRDH